MRSAREALFFGELEARAAELGNVTIARLDSDAGVRLDVDVVATDLGGALGDWTYYLCGPKPMVATVSAGLRKRGLPTRRVHKEEFEFR